MTMLFSQLPYELVVHIGSFLHISDLLSLAYTCTHLNSCLGDRLEIHRHKLATLSSIDDRDRSRTTSLLRILFEQNAADCDDSWYFREAVVHAYSKVLAHEQELDDVLSDQPVPAMEPFGVMRAITDMNIVLPQRGQDFIFDRVYRSEGFDGLEGFEGLLALALLKMPRLARPVFTLHPCHANYHVHWRYVADWVPREPARVQVHELFIAMVRSFESRLMDRSIDTSILPPGLQSLQSIEFTIDELHNRNNFGEYGPLYPDVVPDHFRIFFFLPNLKSLLLSRHPAARRQDSDHMRCLETREKTCCRLFGTSSIEKLTFVGFSGFLESMQLMVRCVRHLRVLILQQRGHDRHVKDLMSILQQQHASSLESFVAPTHTSNALSWCQSFSRLKHLSISYVEVMSLFHDHVSFSLTSVEGAATSANFHLASRIPETVELLIFIGGLISSPVTSLYSAPLCSSPQDIRLFTDIVTTFVSTRRSASRSVEDEQIPNYLRDLCFGDMRVVYKRQDAMDGRRLHSELTEASEIARRQLGEALRESKELKEICSQNGVFLHFTDLATRICDHVDRHPYPPRKRLSRQELLAKAQALSEDADAITKTVLSRYVDNIPVDY